MTATDAPSSFPQPLHLHGLSVDGVNQCVHCGLCLAYCPTFSELGTEMDSPRGRIFLIKSLAEGRIGLTDSTVKHLSLCLDCRACETVCPAGVPYGRLIEAAKVEIERQRPGGIIRRVFRWVNFGLLLPRPRMLSVMATAMRAYQVTGLQRLVRASGILRLLPGTLPAWERLLPRIPSAAERAPLPARVPAVAPLRARVALLSGCVQQAVFASHNHATTRVLARNGYEVLVPADQVCCGALHAHGGDHARAVDLAKRTIEAFERAGVEHVVVNTSGCGAHMKGYGHLLGDDSIDASLGSPAAAPRNSIDASLGSPAAAPRTSTWAGRAEAFARSVRDVAELLAEHPLRGPLSEVPMTVTYHDPCHVVHGQKIRRQPRQLLAQIPGLRIVELEEADWCCGSAGIYNLTQPEMAERLLDRKVRHVLATGADAVVTANPGCILQIAQGLRDRGSPIEVRHVVEILDRAHGS